VSLVLLGLIPDLLEMVVPNDEKLSKFTSARSRRSGTLLCLMLSRKGVWYQCCINLCGKPVWVATGPQVQ